MQGIEKELRERVKRATTELLEWVEKIDFTFVRYEKKSWHEPEEMVIVIATYRITSEQINQIRDIMSRNGLKVTGIAMVDTRSFMTVNIFVTLERGETNVK
jgi:hypothetical protein